MACERTYIARDDTKDGSSPCFSDVIALATGQTPDVEGEIAALVTPDVCFPSGPSCFSSISDFTTPAVCFPHGFPSFFRSRRLRRFPRLPHVNKHLTTSRDYRRNDFSSCLVDNVSPPAASPSTCSLMKSAYRVRNCLLPSFIISSSLFLPMAIYTFKDEKIAYVLCNSSREGRPKILSILPHALQKQLSHLFFLKLKRLSFSLYQYTLI